MPASLCFVCLGWWAQPCHRLPITFKARRGGAALSAIHGNERARFRRRFCKALRSISAATTKIQDGAIADADRGSVMTKAHVAVKLLQALANLDARVLS
jgi:hypothetical protein